MKIPRRITWAFDPNTSALEALKDPQDRTIWAVLRFGHIVDQNFNANVAALGENLRRRPPANAEDMFNRAWHFGLHGYGVGKENAPFTADLEWWGELLEAWLGKITIEHVVAGAAEPAKPAEFVMVPLAPTQPMLDAGNRADYAASTHRTAGLVYEAMLKAAPSNLGHPDTPLLDWLEEAYTKGALHPGEWREFMTRVAEVGYRDAISERISGKGFHAMTGRAFAIADEAMFIAFDSYVPRTMRVLGGAFQLETPISAELKQAIDWLEPRGFLEVTRDPVEPRVVRLIKRPRDAR